MLKMFKYFFNLMKYILTINILQLFYIFSECIKKLKILPNIIATNINNSANEISKCFV